MIDDGTQNKINDIRKSIDPNNIIFTELSDLYLLCHLVWIQSSRTNKHMPFMIRFIIEHLPIDEKPIIITYTPKVEDNCYRAKKYSIEKKSFLINMYKLSKNVFDGGELQMLMKLTYGDKL